jgi:hypothetical protein
MGRPDLAAVDAALWNRPTPAEKLQAIVDLVAELDVATGSATT